MIHIVSFDDKHVKDHGVEEGAEKTLCGRPLVGTNWFYRGNYAFDGKMSYYCRQCCRVLAKGNKHEQ
jgi:hypothetical protein